MFSLHRSSRHWWWWKSMKSKMLMWPTSKFASNGLSSKLNLHLWVTPNNAYISSGRMPDIIPTEICLLLVQCTDIDVEFNEDEERLMKNGVPLNEEEGFDCCSLGVQSLKRVCASHFPSLLSWKRWLNFNWTYFVLGWELFSMENCIHWSSPTKATYPHAYTVRNPPKGSRQAILTRCQQQHTRSFLFKSLLTKLDSHQRQFQ